MARRAFAAAAAARPARTPAADRCRPRYLGADPEVPSLSAGIGEREPRPVHDVTSLGRLGTPERHADVDRPPARRPGFPSRGEEQPRAAIGGRHEGA